MDEKELKELLEDDDESFNQIDTSDSGDEEEPNEFVEEDELDFEEIDDKINQAMKSGNNEYSENSLRQYYNDIRKFMPLSAEEEKKYFTEYAKTKNPRLRELLINSNLKLVLYNVFYMYPYVPKTVETLDLIQSGNSGLITAVERFDVSKGFKFSTYAMWWIQRETKIFIDESISLIRIPHHRLEKVARIKKFENSYMSSNGILPPPEEYQKNLNLDYDDAMKCKQIPSNLASLDMPIGEDEDELLVNYIRDDKNIALETETKIDNASLWYEIKAILDERQYDMVLCRYGKKIDGIGSDEPMTLDGISKNYNLTRERVRVIIDKALRKIKEYYESKEKFFEGKNEKIIFKSHASYDSAAEFFTFLNSENVLGILEKILVPDEINVLLCRVGRRINDYGSSLPSPFEIISKKMNITIEQAVSIEKKALLKLKEYLYSSQDIKPKEKQSNPNVKEKSTRLMKYELLPLLTNLDDYDEVSKILTEEEFYIFMSRMQLRNKNFKNIKYKTLCELGHDLKKSKRYVSRKESEACCKVLKLLKTKNDTKK